MNVRSLKNSLIAVCLLAFTLQVNGFTLVGKSTGWDEEKEIIIVKDNDDDGAWLGVRIDNLTSKLRREMDVKARRGVVIVDVVEDGPAEQAGLQKDDIIVKFNDRKILRATDLTRAIRKHEVGDLVTLEIERDKEMLELEVELGERTDEWIQRLKAPEKHEMKNFDDFKIFFSGVGLGLQFQEMDANLAEYFGAGPGQGLLITKVEEDGPAEKAGVKSGDVLLSVEGEEINEPDDVSDILKEYDEGDIIEVEIIRKEETQTVEIELQRSFDFYKLGVPYKDHRDIYIGNYKRAVDLYKEALDRTKTDIKIRQDEYEDEVKERIRRDLERSMQEQQLQMEKMRDEIERLQERISELEKKVM